MKKLSIKQVEFLKRFGGKEMPSNIADILSKSNFGADYVELNAGMLTRDEYEQVRDFLSSVGGKWKGTGKKNDDGSPKGKFIFEYVEPKDIVETFVNIRFLPKKNPLDFFPTPEKTALELLEFCGLIEKYMGNYEPTRHRPIRVLEPSAGLGGIADVVKKFYPDAEIHCVELNPVSANVLREKGYEVYEQNFLDFDNKQTYDYVLMNPPFDGNTYINHVLHAWNFVDKKTGLLGAIVPDTLKISQNKVEDFWKFVHCMGASEELEKKSFASSGTNVNTRVLYIDAERADTNKKEYNGFPNFGVWHLTLIVENNDADAFYEVQKLSANRTPNRSRIKKIIKDVAKKYIDASGVGCLDDSEIDYIVEYFVRQGQYELDYEDEKNEEKTQKNKDYLMSEIEAFQIALELAENDEERSYLESEISAFQIALELENDFTTL